MIPIHLSVRNFMCYRDPVELDFRGVRVACLSGENGAGKSALLDSITWALWGKARVNSDRDLIAIGAPDMQVEFSFALGEQEFRVSRRRTRGGAGPQTLELHARAGDTWRSLTGNSVRETQQSIDDLLRMDYDTFINSAFILQGRADEFTTKTPAARKHVLGEILNLGDYDRYEEIARLQLKERERHLREIDGELASIDRRLADLPHLQAEVATLSEHLTSLGERADGLRERLDAAEAQVQALEFTASQREMLRQNLASLRQNRNEQVANRQQILARIEDARAILRRRAEIEAREAEWRRLRAEQDAMSHRLAERQELTERRTRLQQQIDQAVARVTAEVQTLDRQIEERDARIRDKAALDERLARAQAEIATMAGLEQQVAAIRERQSIAEKRHGELQAENRRLRADMEEIRARLDQVEAADALCPVCRKALGAEERERLAKSYHEEGTALGARYRDNARESKQIQRDLERAVAELKALEQQRARLLAAERQAAQLAQQQAQVEAAEAERATLVARRDTLRQAIAAGEPGAEHRPELAAIDRQIAALPYDRDEHRAIQARLAELGDVDRERQALEVAQTALERDEEQAARLAEQIARADEQIAKAEADDETLAAQLAQLEPARQRRNELRDTLYTLDRERSEAQERFGAATQRLQDALDLQDRRDDLHEERKQIAEEKMIADELVLAFGKRGIQTMIIENILPELQAEANAILDKMPGNSMRVEFRTQRETARGDGLIETLEILIGDEAGRRPYELYSGGEAFRVNFAIRVALSTLLARRAGTRLQTLVIDEGFGTQDSRGRDGLIEAIRAIERDFATILVITHIAELKELFPTHIEVVKLPGGSRVEVRTA